MRAVAHRLASVALAVLASGAAIAGTAAPQAGAQAQQPSSATRQTFTLTGCVERGASPKEFTVTDQANGKYVVTGSRIERYLGQRVEIAGTRDTNRLHVKGGLYPTPNVAGQAGAMDPARAAVAAMPGGSGSGTGDVALPTFKVKSVKTLGGGCQ